MQERHDNSATGRRRRTLLLAGSLMLIAFNLRTAITSLGPVLVDAIASLGLTGAEASLLTTIPSLCFGLFGPLAPALSRRLGRERALLAVLVLQVLGMALRGLDAAPALFLGQTLAAIGIGVTNVLLPGLVKRDFPRRIAAMTGLYTMSFCLGAAIAAGSTVPLQHMLRHSAGGGTWSTALAFWTLPAALAVLCWLPWIPRRGQGEGTRPSRVHRLWRDPLAWQVSLFMGLQSALAYIVFGWLAPILRDRGLSAIDAGFALSLSVIIQAGASLVAPLLASLGRDQRLANLAAVIVTMIGLLGCIYAPLPTVWIWSFLLGLGQGSTIAIALMLIALRAADPHVATQLSGMVQGIGYLIASCGPLLAGLLHSWTGGWNSVAALSIAIGIGLAASGLGAGRAGHVGAKAASP
jgi:MFS transporter, CP family, cyanate transporter